MFRRIWTARRRARRWLGDHQWLILGGLWLAALSLGYVGAKKQSAAVGEERSLWDPFYRALQLFVLDDGGITSGPSPPWELELARLLGALETRQ